MQPCVCKGHPRPFFLGAGPIIIPETCVAPHDPPLPHPLPRRDTVMRCKLVAEYSYSRAAPTLLLYPFANDSPVNSGLLSVFLPASTYYTVQDPLSQNDLLRSDGLWGCGRRCYSRHCCHTDGDRHCTHERRWGGDSQGGAHVHLWEHHLQIERASACTLGLYLESEHRLSASSGQTAWSS